MQLANPSAFIVIYCVFILCNSACVVGWMSCVEFVAVALKDVTDWSFYAWNLFDSSIFSVLVLHSYLSGKADEQEQQPRFGKCNGENEAVCTCVID